MNNATSAAAPGMVTSGRSAAANTDEQDVLWSARRGQIVNLLLYVYCLALFWCVVPIVYAGYRALATYYHRYELLGDRLRITTGLYRPHIRVKDLRFDEIADVRDATRHRIYRLVHRGDVALTRIDKGLPAVYLEGIHEPGQVTETIRQAISAHQTRQAA